MADRRSIADITPNSGRIDAMRIYPLNREDRRSTADMA